MSSSAYRAPLKLEKPVSEIAHLGISVHRDYKLIRKKHYYFSKMRRNISLQIYSWNVEGLSASDETGL